MCHLLDQSVSLIWCREALLTYCTKRKELKKALCSRVNDAMTWALQRKIHSSFCALVFNGATSICLPFFFILMPRSCGHGRVWRHARTNPKALCDSGIPAQPGPTGWDLSHNADRQAQIWRLSGVWCDALTPPLSQQLGEEAANDQNGGTEDAASMMVVFPYGSTSGFIWDPFALLCETLSISSLCCSPLRNRKLKVTPVSYLGQQSHLVATLRHCPCHSSSWGMWSVKLLIYHEGYFLFNLMSHLKVSNQDWY